MSKDKNLEKDWAERIKNSNGTMLNVPESIKKETEEFQKASDDYMEKARAFDRFTAEFDLEAKRFWLNMRKALETEGNDKVWNHNIGFNQQAKVDGLTVINLAKPTPQGLEM